MSQQEAFNDALKEVYQLTVDILEFCSASDLDDKAALEQARTLSETMLTRGNKMLLEAAKICVADPSMAGDVYKKVSLAKSGVIDAMSFVNAKRRSQFSLTMIENLTNALEIMKGDVDDGGGDPNAN